MVIVMNSFYKIISFEKLNSTNTYAKEHLDILPNYSIITANQQTQGKGRLGKTWSSPPNVALYSTFVLKQPDFDFSLLPLLSALAVCKTINTITTLPCQIKWPNDVILNNKKLCGILCESVIKGNERSVICGIGININQDNSDFDMNELPYATSLLLETGSRYSIIEVRDCLIPTFYKVLSDFITNGFLSFQKEYERQLINIGKTVRVVYLNQEVQAVALGILENGNLLCQNNNGTFSVHSGEASVRGLYGYV